MRYLSVCSGIEAVTCAWHHMGWQPMAFSEIEPFPCAVLAHHYPDVPNLGDMTKFKEWPDHAIDLLVGGTPCQSFSVAGLRKGLADPRGNLMLVFGAIAERYRPSWLVWENVPGVLSSGGGRDFGAFLGMLGELGYGWAYRILDAQYFGVAQRRRRVFVVGYLGDWRRAAAVLFERESLSGHPAPSREKGQEATPTTRSGAAGGGLGSDFDCDGGLVPECYALAGPMINRQDQNGPKGSGVYRQICPTQTKCDVHAVAVAFAQNTSDEVREMEVAGALAAEPGMKQTRYIRNSMQVRRLTPTECERLQGFPDGYTDIRPKGKDTPDGPRYKALGNSMAVPVMRWIGQRIQMIENLEGGQR